MSYRRWLEMCPTELTTEQHVACTFLESRGLRFMIDFGYLNAVDLMWGEAFSDYVM